MKKISGVGKRQIFRSFFKRINDPYDLRIRNAIDGEEIMHLALTKKSVYLLISTFLVFSFLAVSLLFLFTPIKYYIPGFETHDSRKKIVSLQSKLDSMQNFQQQSQLMFQHAMLASNENETERDTTVLKEGELINAELSNTQEIETRNKRAKRIELKPDSAISR
jgi:hypothetical protein